MSKVDKKIYRKVLRLFDDKPKKFFSSVTISKKLQIDNLKELKKVLSTLVKNKVIIEAFDGRYILNSENIKIGEVIDFNKLLYDNKEIEIANLSPEAVVIGDQYFFIEKKEKAYVIAVYKRRKKEIVGKLQFQYNFAFFIPKDKIFFKDPIVEFEDLMEAKDSYLVEVKIKKWPSLANPTRAKAKVIRVFGTSDDIRSQMDALLINNDIKKKFPKAVKEEVKYLKEYNIGVDNRVDLRDEKVFTIDPDDAKDFDDAISIKKLDENYILKVHIADVSYYVKKGSNLDKEALKRGNSIYLVGSVIPMLPHKLSNELCSLRPNELKPAFTVEMKVSPKGELLETKFYESIIISKRRFTYKEAQKVIDGELDDPLKNELLLAKELADILINRTNERGYLDFSLPEIEIELDSENKPKKIGIKKQLFAHRLIEEFMLLANESVARFLDKKKVPFIYRIHERPEETKLREALEYMKNFGIEFDPNVFLDSKALSRILLAIEDSPFHFLINDQILRSMQKAIYSPINKGHFGLALDIYTHFTSPIRRYADLVVHRILKSVLKGEPINYELTELASISEHISVTERTALTLERESIKLTTLEYMKNYIGEQFTGVVSGIINNGFFVMIDEMAVEGLVLFKDLPNEIEILFADNCYFLNNIRLHVGLKAKIEVSKVDIARRILDFKLIELEGLEL